MKKVNLLNGFYSYKAFGLKIRSEILLPELLSWKESSDYDVVIRYGKAPLHLNHPVMVGGLFQASPGEFLFKMNNIANYYMINGKEILIDKPPTAADKDVRVFLLSSVFSALIQEKGYLPFHASSVRIGDQCVLFCGGSGTGKSTLAKIFVKKGYSFMSDDICAVSIDNQGNPIAYSSYPQIKLWEDVIKNIDNKAVEYKKTRKNIGKYMIPVQDEFYSHLLPVKKIYVVTPHNKREIELNEISGIDRFTLLKKNIFRQKFAKGLGKEIEQFQLLSAVCEKIPCSVIKRTTIFFELEKLVDLLEKDMNL